MPKKRFTFEEVRAYFEEQGCELLSDTYKGSTVKLRYRCSCGNVAEIEYRLFRSGKRCRKCSRTRANATNREHHDGVLYCQTNQFAERRKQTWLGKYGVDSPLKSPDILEKREHTNMERYGVPSVAQVEEHKAAARASMKERYGFEHSMQIPEIKEKYKQTLLDRYGVPSMAYLSRCASKESQELFVLVHARLPEEFWHSCYFASHRGEFVVCYEKEYFKYDFVHSQLKRAIEYNGSKFHPKPDLPSEATGWCVFHPHLTAGEARAKEARKKAALERRGYQVLVIWDTQYKQAREQTVEECLAFLHQEILRR